jgi:hypothetical protein
MGVQVACVLRAWDAIAALSIFLYATLGILVGPIDEGVQAVLLIVADIQRAWVVVIASSILGHTAATVDSIAAIESASHLIIAVQRVNCFASGPRSIGVGVAFFSARADILIIAEV